MKIGIEIKTLEIGSFKASYIRYKFKCCHIVIFHKVTNLIPYYLFDFGDLLRMSLSVRFWVESKGKCNGPPRGERLMFLHFV